MNAIDSDLLEERQAECPHYRLAEAVGRFRSVRHIIPNAASVFPELHLLPEDKTKPSFCVLWGSTKRTRS